MKRPLALLLLSIVCCRLLAADTLPITFTEDDGLPGIYQDYTYYPWPEFTQWSETYTLYGFESRIIKLDAAVTKLRFTVMDTNTEDYHQGTDFKCFALSEFYILDERGKKLTLTESNFATNAQEVTEGAMAGICDGDYGTYFHSSWSSSTYPLSTAEHYIEVTLPKSLKTFAFGFVSRNKRCVPIVITVSDPTAPEPEPEPTEDFYASITEDVAGQEWSLCTGLDVLDATDYTAFQLTLSFPAGLGALVTDADVQVLTLSNERRAATHVVRGATQRDGTYRVLAYATDNAPFRCLDGDLFTLQLAATRELTPGSDTIRFSDIRLTTVDGKERLLKDIGCPIHISPRNAIRTVDADADGTGADTFADLQGRIVTEPRKGIYIVNGRKVLVQ